jgi:hypothetical protein
MLGAQGKPPQKAKCGEKVGSPRKKEILLRATQESPEKEAWSFPCWDP